MSLKDLQMGSDDGQCLLVTNDGPVTEHRLFENGVFEKGAELSQHLEALGYCTCMPSLHETR